MVGAFNNVNVQAPLGTSGAYSDSALRHMVAHGDMSEMLAAACRLRDAGHGATITYSRKVFIPLTKLCRDVCSYCTFAHPPRKGENAYLTADEVLEIARAGAKAGCTEALFTLGDKPELRYRVAREELERLGHPSTISYLAAMCKLVLDETGLLPHANPGVMTRDEIALLRDVTISQGIMLESISERLCEPGGPHYGSPDKHPAVRLEATRLAGELQVPFTSGLLIGIGETRDERLDALLALRDLHREHGHLQEIIIQNFRAKPNTRMANAPDPDLDELMWTIALARLVFGPEMNIQAPPNLSGDEFGKLINAGINDWGGVSPVTPDHVNPEAAWPQIEVLRRETEAQGKVLVHRLAAYPSHISARWQSEKIRTPLLRATDSEGWARSDAWSPGVAGIHPPVVFRKGTAPTASPAIAGTIAKARAGKGLSETDIVTLFAARGRDFDAICAAADDLRREVSGDVVRYVVNRNINYTNVCYFKCGFCAFSKGKTAEALRGKPYDLAHDEITRRVIEAWDRGATEVCMQGGIHPNYTGATYIEILRTVKRAVPEMHIHAFSPLEVMHGAETLKISVPEFLKELKAAGLGTMPGTAAEVLDDEVRAILCPDKLNTDEWIATIGAAHEAGLRSTSTIMFGHVDNARNWARHLLRLRALQERTGGITEFVPLPFVHMEAPLYLKGRARKGPTWRETVLMHAIARLALHPVIPNIQVSWVKAGTDGVRFMLQAGANDLGGTLMNESISRAAGTEHGQEMPPEAMEKLIRSIGRTPVQRTTLYGTPSESQRAKSYAAAPLSPVVQTPLSHRPSPQTVAAE
jgi:FO synthase